MVNVTLTDNNIAYPPLLTDICGEENPIPVFEDLSFIAGRNLDTLCKENPGLMVFPKCLGMHNDGIEELSVIEFDGSPGYDDDKIRDVEKVRIRTGNLMGFIGIGGKGHHDTRIEIRSRFTENNGQDYFLHYMLEKVFRINLFDMSYSHGKNDGFDLLYLIFPHLLKQALGQGLFRTYRTFRKNDPAVKGVIDINRHIKQNTPFNGNLAYRSREYSSDNDMTQLIRHTIEFLKQKEIGKTLLNADNDTKFAVSQIIAATDPSYCLKNRTRIIYNNLRPVNHPYFLVYKHLQQLCLLILNHQSVQYAQSNSPIYGILFDGAWLWEEYLATILCDSKLGEHRFCHPENKIGTGGIRLFDNSGTDEGENVFNKCYHRIYPDFYRRNTGDEEKDGMILDAKYKHLDNTFVHDDLYQVIAYMHTMKIDAGGFIYPCRDEYKKDDFRLAGYGGNIYRIGFGIPQSSDSYKDFCDGIQASEEALVDFPAVF